MYKRRQFLGLLYVSCGCSQGYSSSYSRNSRACFPMFISYCIVGLGAFIHWTGLLDTGVDYWTELFSFLDKFLLERTKSTFFTIIENPATTNDCNNNSCLLHCFQQYINLKLSYSHLINKSYTVCMCKLSLQILPCVSLFLTSCMVGPRAQSVPFTIYG